MRMPLPGPPTACTAASTAAKIAARIRRRGRPELELPLAPGAFDAGSLVGRGDLIVDELRDESAARPPAGRRPCGCCGSARAAQRIGRHAPRARRGSRGGTASSPPSPSGQCSSTRPPSTRGPFDVPALVGSAAAAAQCEPGMRESVDRPCPGSGHRARAPQDRRPMRRRARHPMTEGVCVVDVELQLDLDRSTGSGAGAVLSRRTGRSRRWPR